MFSLALACLHVSTELSTLLQKALKRKKHPIYLSVQSREKSSTNYQTPMLLPHSWGRILLGIFFPLNGSGLLADIVLISPLGPLPSFSDPICVSPFPGTAKVMGLGLLYGERQPQKFSVQSEHSLPSTVTPTSVHQLRLNKE